MSVGLHSVTVHLPGGVETGRNLVPNPSGETNSDGWVAVGTGTTVRAAALSSAQAGANVIVATMGTAAFSGTYIEMPATPGTRYGHRARLRGPDAADPLYLRLQFRNSAGTQISIIDGKLIAGLVNTWYTHSVEGVAPTGTVTMRLYAERKAANATTAHRLFVDQVLASEVGHTDPFNPNVYFDGNTADTSTVTYAWTGIANLSQSTRTVADADLGKVVDSVAINHGRDDSAAQPEAASATINFTARPDNPLPLQVDVGATVAITTTTANGSFDRFHGKITDISLGWDEEGELTPDAGVGQITAIADLADLGRRVIGDVPFPQELDGARVARVMAAAGVTLDPLTSDPGIANLLPRDVDARAALEVAHAAATSANGVLWHTRGGSVRYADAQHRRGIASTLTLDACDLLVSPQWRRTTEGLTNEVSIGYGPVPEEGEQPRYVEARPDSIARWGKFAYTSQTELADQPAAQRLGALILARNADPVWVMAALPVDVDGLDDARYEALLALDMHSLISLTGLPSLGHAPTSASLWVEGWREELAFGYHSIELVVSGYCRTSPPTRWNDAGPQTTWNAMPHRMTWNDAACLGPTPDQGRWDDQPATLRWDQLGDVRWDTYFVGST